MKEIKVLGPGCAKCKKLDENVKTAMSEVGGEYDYEYVTDIQKIMNYGILMTPGLVVEGKVVSVGRVLPVRDIVDFIK
ncbi:thioredoxin family protein [Bacteroidetes/Chlorobi group bacterium ChocPot_Mid]|jgi:small redox-active disulfide protein 2|nr:MAG: thioredoxin family protein [Bacteroidetes/Chlorobi group bacterium ChocPot_Mid]